MPKLRSIVRLVSLLVVITGFSFAAMDLVTAPVARAASLVCAASSWVNVRSGPGTSYPVLGRLLAGQTIESTGTTTASGWTPVTFNGKAAYVHSSYLRAPAASSAQGSVAGYRGVQLANAGQIIKAGRVMGLDDWTITVGVMTAMGESSLVNVDHGDKAGPDSRGLFQQRANGAWGSYSDRMNPAVSAANFFKALLRVPGYHALTPTLAAHRTQRNRDPNHYAKYWPAAVEVFTSLAGSAATSVSTVTAQASVTVNVRAGAGLDFPIVAVAGRGSLVTLTGRTANGFSEITQDGQALWVYTKYLVATPAA